MLRKYTTVNWSKSLLALMPPLLRKNKQAQWLNTLLKPLNSVYDDTLYKMQHNGQVMYMEKVLNEFFNKTREYKPYFEEAGEKKAKGLIFIDDATRPEVQYLYTHNEIQDGHDPILTYTNNNELGRRPNFFLFLASDLDFNSTEYFNFRINIPSDLVISVDKFKEAVTKVMDDTTITEDEKRILLDKIYCKLIKGGKHPFTSHQDAVRIQTPIFHKIVNFYKLAGKSYETREYEFNKTEPSLED